MNIKLDNVSKSYDKNVLNNINLEVSGYEAIAIIGKSGCGKSTLLRLMTGLEVADEGKIIINNNQIEKKGLRLYQDKISMVFQQHNLFPHLTLKENITVILNKVGMLESTKSNSKATSLLTQLHLHDEMDKRPRYVSGGQAQRASIARALATDPEIVFMDEPTAALDPILTKEVLSAIDELKKLGTKFVFVTHELSFVKKFADYVVFMDEGSVVEEGEVNILFNPKTNKLKHFLSK